MMIDHSVIGLIMLGILVLVVLIGVHVGVALALLSVVGIWLTVGNLGVATSILGNVSYSALTNYAYVVVPLFVMMGCWANVSGASDDLYCAANALLGNIRGRLGIATVAANAVFAAMTGVSVASAAMFSQIAYPQMMRHGYDKKFALGTVASSSLLGLLIPPSALMVIYGILAEASIGKLFLGGVLPGVIMAVLLMGTIWFIGRFRPAMVGGNVAVSGVSKIQTVKRVSKAFPMVGLVAVTMGGIYLGIFTPTEAAAIGAFGLFMLTVAKRKLSGTSFWQVLTETSYVGTSIMFLLVGADMYARMLAMTGLVERVAGLVLALHVAPMVVVIGICVLFFIMGLFLDSTSIFFMTLPIFVPAVAALGFNIVWFGIVAIIAVEIGAITPPFGLVVFAMKGALGAEVTTEDIFKGSAPFYVALLLTLILVITFPLLALALGGKA